MHEHAVLNVPDLHFADRLVCGYPTRQQVARGSRQLITARVESDARHPIDVPAQGLILDARLNFPEANLLFHAVAGGDCQGTRRVPEHRSVAMEVPTGIEPV